MTDRHPTAAELREREDDLQRKSQFACLKCGERFPSIEATYAHLDEEHADDRR